MTIDSSVILTILQNEPERAEFIGAIERAERRLMSTVSVLETAMVLQGRRGDEAGYLQDVFLRRPNRAGRVRRGTTRDGTDGLRAVRQRAASGGT